MAINDPIGDMLTRIRNGQNVRLARVTSPSSRLRKSVLNVLKDEGYIADFAERQVRKGIDELDITLRYYQGEPAIKNIGRVSKPGLRQYTDSKHMPRIRNGLGMTILSTSKGILADYKARELNVGGEILCEVF